MNNSGMTANGNFIITKPRNTLAHIINVFARYRHYNIILDSVFLLFGGIFADEGQCFIGKQAVSCVYLPVVDARHTVLTKVFFLKAAASADSGNFTELFVFHTVRAKLFYQMFNLRHL